MSTMSVIFICKVEMSGNDVSNPIHNGSVPWEFAIYTHVCCKALRYGMC